MCAPIAGLVVALVAAPWVAAGEPPHALGGPWDAIGRVELTSGGFCTGALVAPRVVVTAAHCLYEDDHTPDPAVRFELALRGERGLSLAEVRRTVVPDGFDAARFADSPDVDGLDYAFLVLQAPVAAVTPLAVRSFDELPNDPGAFLAHAGYSDDDPGHLTATLGCAVTEVFEDRTFSHDCVTLEGDSGSPMLWIGPEGIALVGVESASYKDDDSTFNVTVASDAFIGDLATLVAELGAQSDGP